MFGDVVAVAHRQVCVDGHGEIGHEAVAEPTGSGRAEADHAGRTAGNLLDGLDDDGVDGVHESVVDLACGADEHGEDGDGDGEPDDGVGAIEAGPNADRANGDGEGGEAVGAGVVAVGDEGGGTDGVALSRMR